MVRTRHLSALVLVLIPALATSVGARRAAAQEEPAAAQGDAAVAQAEAAVAQAAPGASAEEIRTTLIADFERHRAMDVAVARAIPDTALRWAPTPGVRDFAQQVEHIAQGNALIVAGAVSGEDGPSLGDPEAYLNDKEALVGVVNEAYDYVLGTLRELPAARFTAETELFGQRLATWRVYVLALAHADWTRGQLVPYFRLHGVDPPDWRLF